MIFNKLVVLDSVIFFPEHRVRLEALADRIVEYNTCGSEDEVSERCRGADGIISCWVDIPHRIVDENPQLKAVAFWTHDFEHRIDATYAQSRGIVVPAIPDYGTDSVAELVFIGLLRLLKDAGGGAAESPEEAIAFALADDVRLFSRNVKDALNGRWVHEYVKTGQLHIDSTDGIPAETLKGMTVGVLGPGVLTASLVDIVVHGLRMNMVYSLADGPHSLGASYRPVRDLLAESQILVYDSRSLPADVAEAIAQGSYVSRVDVAQLDARRSSLRGKRLGVLGLGRIGSRVAQIAVEGFGMDVQYHSRTRKPALEQQLGLRYCELDELLTESDIVSVHLPHHGAEDFITREHVARIPNGRTLVNCSVGTVIADEEHLLDRCEKGELSAYLDVYRTLPPKQRLRAVQDRVVATYRLGWRTKATVGLKTHKLLTKLESLPVLSG